MADPKGQAPEEKPPVEGPHEKVIRIVVQSHGEKGHELIIAQGSSNYYTDRNYNSDTCCTCQS